MAGRRASPVRVVHNSPGQIGKRCAEIWQSVAGGGLSGLGALVSRDLLEKLDALAAIDRDPAL